MAKIEKNSTERSFTANTSTAIHFILKGAQKRRSLAYGKAKMLQRDLGVIPRLVSIK